jgi:hypothetical protein
VTLPDRDVRARTRAGRLAALDAWLVRAERPLLERGDGEWAGAGFIDVGFGERLATTLEAAAALRAVRPDLPVIAVERDASRAQAALDEAGAAEVHVVEGGFDVLASLRPARVVRAVNVLRAYRDDEVPAIHGALAAPLLTGGLVLEGSTDEPGAITAVHLLRRTADGVTREGLLFHTDFSRGFSPWMFRDWLPRDLRRSVRPGTAIHDLLTAWNDAWQRVRAPARSLPDVFRDTALELAKHVVVTTDDWALSSGYLRVALR